MGFSESFFELKFLYASEQKISGFLTTKSSIVGGSIAYHTIGFGFQRYIFCIVPLNS